MKWNTPTEGIWQNFWTREKRNNQPCDEKSYICGLVFVYYDCKFVSSRIEEKVILTMFSQIVSAIRYMHNKSVLHRDLKTANIFLTKDVQVKIGDFGISKVLTTQQVIQNCYMTERHKNITY